MSADALVSMAGATMKERAAKWPTDDVSMSTDLCPRLPRKAMRGMPHDLVGRGESAKVGGGRESGGTGRDQRAKRNAKYPPWRVVTRLQATGG